jgi:hypothetical protein
MTRFAMIFLLAFSLVATGVVTGTTNVPDIKSAQSHALRNGAPYSMSDASSSLLDPSVRASLESLILSDALHNESYQSVRALKKKSKKGESKGKGKRKGKGTTDSTSEESSRVSVPSPGHEAKIRSHRKSSKSSKEGDRMDKSRSKGKSNKEDMPSRKDKSSKEGKSQKEDIHSRKDTPKKDRKSKKEDQESKSGKQPGKKDDLKTGKGKLVGTIGDRLDEIANSPEVDIGSMPSTSPITASQFPSGNPMVMPSDVPSLVPSDVPSDMPSDLPSDLPSVSPSMGLSHPPTTELENALLDPIVVVSGSDVNPNETTVHDKEGRDKHSFNFIFLALAVAGMAAGGFLLYRKAKKNRDTSHDDILIQ